MSTRYVWGKYNVNTSSSVVSSSEEIHYLYTSFISLTCGESYTVDSSGNFNLSNTMTLYSGDIVFANRYRYILVGNILYDSRLALVGNIEYYWELIPEDGKYRLIIRDHTNIQNPTDDHGFVKIENKVTQSMGSFIENVSSSSSTACPTDGISGSYWYKYLGSDNIDPSGVTYSKSSPTAGSSITISATPKTSTYGGTIYYQFQYSTNNGSSWTSAGSKSTSSSVSVTVPSGATQFKGRVIVSDGWGFSSTTYVTGSNLTVSAAVTSYTVSLSVSPSGAGTVSGSGGYASGSSVTVTATAGSGYKFSYWQKSGSSVSTSSSYTFTISANTSLTAVFVVSSSGGTTTTDKIGAYVGISNKARKVEKIYVGVSGKAREVIKGYVGVNGKARLFWEGIKKFVVSLLVSPSGSGTVSGAGTYEDGTAVTVSGTPGNGYIFSSWKENGVSVSTNSSYEFIATKNVTLTAEFSVAPLNWKASTLPISAFWQKIIYGGGKFVAVGLTEQVLYSTNGISWSTSTLPNFVVGSDVAYGNGKFVVVDGRKSAYSSDCINWTETSISSDSSFSIVAYGSGKFVAIGGTKVAYSTNGISWTDKTISSSEEYWTDIVYGNNKFVAIIAESNKAIYSADGITWKESNLPYSASWRSVTYGNGKFVAVASGSNKAAYSEDGITWEYNFIPYGSWIGSAYGDGKFVAVSSNSNKAAYTLDGINWTSSTLPSSEPWISVAYGNNKFVAISTENSNKSAYTY